MEVVVVVVEMTTTMMMHMQVMMMVMKRIPQQINGPRSGLPTKRDITKMEKSRR